MGCKDIVACDANVNRLEALQQDMGIAGFSHLDQVLDLVPEAVVICTPPVFHTDIAVASVMRGCHLFIEKPLAHTLDKLDGLEQEVTRRGLVTLVGCNFKFHPNFIKMKEILLDGTIGKILSARCQFGQYLPDWHPWEDYRQGYSARSDLGGGILLDSHEFDYLSWFLGDIKRLVCFAGKISALEIDTEDTAEVLLEFASGTIAGMHLDYTQRAYQRNYEFFGEKGTLKWDFNEKKVSLFCSSNKEWQFFPEPADYDLNNMYIEEMKHFLQCLKGESTSITDFARGKRILKAILAAKESAKRNLVISLEPELSGSL